MEFTRLYVLRETPDWVLWRGEHPRSQSRVRCAIKEPQPGKDRRPAVRRLREEYEFLKSLDHPRLALPREWDETGGRLVYPDIQATLAQLIAQQGRLPADLVANVLRQVAEGLEYLHGRKVGHGGLSAEAVFVAADGRVRLGGFIGYRFDPQAQPPPPDPAARYQAPELLTDGVAACTQSSDLYNLGFLALEMLAGPGFDQFFRKPGSGAAGGNLLGWHMSAQEALPPVRTLLPDLVEAVATLIDQLVVKAPAGRGFQTAGELLRALADFRLTSDRSLPPFQSGLPPGTATATALATPLAAPAALPAPPAGEATRAPGPDDLVLTGWGGRGGTTESTHRFPASGSVLVGGATGCDLGLAGAGVGGKHALLVFGNGAWVAHDLRAEGGTFVNGQRVRSAELRPGDDLRFAAAEFRVASAPARAKPGQASGPVEPGPGATVNRRGGSLTLGRVLHEGSLGALYQAVWRSADGFGRPVAVRVYPPEFSRSLSDIRRMIRGHVLGDRARHGNVLRVFGAGRVQGGAGRPWWYLAMELMPGGSLRDRMRKGKLLTAAEAVRCGLDVAAGLAAAADRSPPLLHRNVNPSCVLFAADGTAKLGDFALLRPEVLATMQRITQTAAAHLPGEQVYRAPELLRGSAAVAGTDIYGLGATLYAGVTGRPPVPAEADMPSQINAILHARVAPADIVNPAVPGPLARALGRALEKDPAARFPNLAAFADALRAAQ